MTRKKQRGFSLIELLIVVAIILIIASIAIPNLMRARINANETSAVGSIRAINSGMISYMSAYPTVGFPASSFWRSVFVRIMASLLDQSAMHGCCPASQPNRDSWLVRCGYWPRSFVQLPSNFAP